MRSKIQVKFLNFFFFKIFRIQGQGPIHVASKNDDVICLTNLLAISRQIDGNYYDELFNVDDNGFNPLHIAVKYKSIKICRGKFSKKKRFIFSNIVLELLDIDKNGRLLEQAENKCGNSPLQMAILAKNELFAEEIAKRCSADQINHRNFQGETSLHMAGRAGMATRIFNFEKHALKML